jgi:hypothetical protein
MDLDSGILGHSAMQSRGYVSGFNPEDASRTFHQDTAVQPGDYMVQKPRRPLSK